MDAHRLNLLIIIKQLIAAENVSKSKNVMNKEKKRLFTNILKMACGIISTAFGLGIGQPGERRH